MTEPTRNYQHYEVLRRGDGSVWELGRGAMGVTYKAFDVNLCCEVALKVVNSALLDHPDARERFVREARSAAALRHRNVASVYHLGNDGAHYFYAMEFIDGETLDAFVRRQGPLPVYTVLSVILQVTKALAAAARQNLVHRDIKPANLMIVHEDADDEMTIKVIDFGLARPAAGVEGAAQVTIGGFVGTPQYASPEQLEERPLDARSDIYSLGVTAWYLLTSRPPFSGSLAAVCQQQLHQPPPWEYLPPDFPPCVRDLLTHMLAKDPADRPQDARELRAEIESCLESLPKAEWKFPADRTVDFAASSQDSRDRKSTGSPQHAPLTTLGGGRYRLSRLLAETNGSRIYLAHDHEEEARPVIIRTVPAQDLNDAGAENALQEEVRLIQAAAHPHLVRIYALEPAVSTAPVFLVEEALASFSLRDLLAARNGALSLAETLLFLDQIAEVVDQAQSYRLEHVDFALSSIRIHFPFAGSEAEDTQSVRALLPLVTGRWPEWTLKIHPLSTRRRGEEELNTWAGELTLIPSGKHAGNLAFNGADAGSSHYLRQVAALTCELLGGPLAAGVFEQVGKRSTAALPALSESGNAVLREALSGHPRFVTCHDFYLELAATAELRATGQDIRPAHQPISRGEMFAGTAEHPLSDARAVIETNGPSAAVVNRAESTVHPWTHNGNFTAGENRSVADIFRGGVKDLSADESEFVGEGSAWERMSMTAGQPVRPGRWLLGLIAAGLVFCAVFAAVLAMLLHSGSKTRDVPGSARLSLTSKPSPPVQPAVTLRRQNPLSTPLPMASVVPAFSVAPSPESTVSAPAMAVGSTSTPALVASSPATPTTPSVSVYLHSQKNGVEVRWKGKLLGVTPLNVELPPGEQELVVSYPNGPETHQTLALSAEQPRTSVEIRPMRSDLLPLNFPPTATRPERAVRNRFAPTPPGKTNNSVRVESAVPVAPPPVREAIPVRRPLPLDPFVNGPASQSERASQSPVPAAGGEN